MAAMNLNEKAQLATTAAVGVGVAAVVFVLYRSGVFKGLTNLAGEAFDIVGGATELVNHTVTSAKNGVEWAWDGWNTTSGLGMSQLGQLANGNYGQMYGSAVEATSAYAVIRMRDFDSAWKIKDIAYKAIVKMHPDNKAILEKYVLDGMGLKPALQKLVKVTDFVIVFKDGSFKSA
jgi:hypothetical protein